LAATTALATVTLAACSSGGNSNVGSGSHAPIVIGASLSLTGDFSTDGQAFDRGYQLWANYVNTHGGLLGGRKVKLVILNDASNPTTVTTNYTKLITSDHANLVFGPFSTLLTVPSAKVASRYGMSMIEGAGGGPAVFQLHLPNVFDPSPTIANQLVLFAHWVASLPPSQRPKTAAYPMANDPFADPPVQLTQSALSKAGIRTVYSHIFPAEVPDYAPAANNVAATHADVVVLGSTDVPTVNAFVKAFRQQHYTPKIFIAAAGPDQGSAFTSAVGVGNASGIMVPNAWYGGSPNPESQKMVAEYIKIYHGTASDINADVAEAYSVGQVAQQAVEHLKSLDNGKIIAYLHSGVTLQTVQGPVKFDSLGRNAAATTFIFQWQNGKFVQVLPAGSAGSVSVLNPKPAWK
jgi:branched-chain amino acid transport system substrate-binding protein